MATQPPPVPPLVWLRAFEAAARHLNFTEAGKEIGLTQAAVSQQTRLLEDLSPTALEFLSWIESAAFHDHDASEARRDVSGGQASQAP